MIPIRVLQNRNVALFGLGRSGLAAARALGAGGADVAAWDDNEVARANALTQGLKLVDLTKAEWGAFAALVLAPGVPLTHPEPHWVVNRAREAGVEIIGDTELFFRELAACRSGAKLIAITGTNGKSTTAALVAHILREAGRDVALGGNIGTAVLDLPELDDERIYVIEFSSFQIDLTPGMAADAAALLNITPDHLDRHGTLEAYAAVKARVFSGIGPEGTAVISVDDTYCQAITDGLDMATQVRISAERPLDDGLYVADGILYAGEGGEAQAIVDLAPALSLRGRHNWQNAAVAMALARAMGLGDAEIARGLLSFPGLAHRMEEVGRLDGVAFVNDSKATNAEAAAMALASYDEIYWIAGGRAKDGGIEGLAPYFPKIVKAYLIGEAAENFAETLGTRVPHEFCGTTEVAVAAAARDATGGQTTDSTVVFAPACASFDQFPNFEVRGDAFREAVARLEGVAMRQREAA